MTRGPMPFEVHEAGELLHGTKAGLVAGDLLIARRLSNFEAGRVMNHVYVTETLDAAVWGAELAAGHGAGRIYSVEAIGPLEDDPNVTDKKFPGNPTRSYRTRDPVRVVGEVTSWTGHPAGQLEAMKDRLADLRRRGAGGHLRLTRQAPSSASFVRRCGTSLELSSFLRLPWLS